MKILNKTDKELRIRVTDRYGHMYSIYLPGGKSTDLEPDQISRDVLDFIKAGYLKEVSSDLKKSHTAPISVQSISEVVECACSIDAPKKHTDDVLPENSSENTEDFTDEELLTPGDEEVVELSTSIHKCDICGCEFASPRGLSMHKSRSHPTELNKEV